MQVAGWAIASFTSVAQVVGSQKAVGQPSQRDSRPPATGVSRPHLAHVLLPMQDLQTQMDQNRSLILCTLQRQPQRPFDNATFDHDVFPHLQSMTFGEDKDPALVDMIARWVIAMPYVLKAHVTEVKDLSVQLQVRS